MDLLIILLFCVFAYLIFSGLISNFLENNPVNKKRIFWIACIVLILLAGFRGTGLDPDSITYQRYYESPDILLLAEPTFAIISIFVRETFNDFKIILLIYAILGIFLKFYAIDRLADLKYLTIITYFGNYFLLHDFTQIRAGVASAIFLLAIIPLTEKKFIKFCILILIAFFFHYSSLILLPLWFLSNDKLNKKWKTLLYVLLPISMLLHFTKINFMVVIPIETIKYKIQAYQEAQEIAENALNVFNLLYIVKYLLFFVFLIFYDKIYPNYKYFTILLKIYGFSLAFYLIFSQNTILAMRVSELLGIVEILLIPLLYYVIKVRSFTSFIVVLISGIYLYINIYYIILFQVF